MKRINEVEIASTINDLPIMAGSKGQARRLIMCGKVAQAQLEADREDMRDLFEEIERNCKGYGNSTIEQLFRSMFWQALKDKFLKEE